MKKQFREVKAIDLVTHAILSPLLIVAIWVLTPTVLVDLIPVETAFVYIGAALPLEDVKK